MRAGYFIVEPERSHLIEIARLVDEGRLRVDVAPGAFLLKTLPLRRIRTERAPPREVVVQVAER